MDPTNTNPTAELSPEALELQQLKAENARLRKEAEEKVQQEKFSTENALNKFLDTLEKTVAGANHTKDTPSLNKIEPFDGDWEKYESFYNSLLILFESKPAIYKTHPEGSKHRILSAMSYLTKGRAERWNAKKVREYNNAGGMPGWETYEKEMRKHFSDPDPKRTARKQMRKLVANRMEGSTADQYITDFETIEPLLNQDEEALLEKFEDGLSADLLKRIYEVEELPKGLEQWKDRARLLDRQQRAQREREELMKKGTSHKAQYSDRPRFHANSNSSYVPSTTTPVANHSQPAHRADSSGTTFGGQGQPMDIDAARRRTKCYNCNEFGHIARFCTKRKAFDVRQLAPQLTVAELEEMLKMKKGQDGSGNASASSGGKDF